MGGSMYRGYGDYEYLPARGAQPEWNILNDIPSARKLFAAGVPVDVMPLDSTQVKLDEVKRAALFRLGTPLTDRDIGRKLQMSLANALTIQHGSREDLMKRLLIAGLGLSRT